MASEPVLACIGCITRFTPLDELASTLKNASQSSDGSQPKNAKLQKGRLKLPIKCINHLH